MNSSILRVQVFSDTWKETINIIIDQYQRKNRKDTKRCKKRTLERTAFEELKQTDVQSCVLNLCLNTIQQLLLHFFFILSLWTPCGGSIRPGGGRGVMKMEECNLLTEPGPPPEFWIYISSSTVSSRLQLLITTTLHHRLSTVPTQHLFRWTCLKIESIWQ